jgi:glycogen debranching enzyme
MSLTILEGSTFCISDELGDFLEPTAGFFEADTRFLSRFLLTINRERPLLLSSRKVEYYSAAFWLRNPAAGDLRQDELSIARRRFVGDEMQEHLSVANLANRMLEFELALEFGNDFADIFTVKEHDFSLGHPREAPPLPDLVRPRDDGDAHEFLLTDRNGFQTQIVLSEPGDVEGGAVRYRVALRPREEWRLRVDVLALLDGPPVEYEPTEMQFGYEPEHVAESLAAWHLRIPDVRASWDELSGAYHRSVADLASLRIRGPNIDTATAGQLPAAGMPWFMTVFGRDTLIAPFQTLLLGPELAETALRVLAELQANVDAPEIDAEPGKIVHELRQGKGADAWFPRYYGTVDATPLYLVLLSEVWRWTDDAQLVNELRDPALAALTWIDDHGDLDGDGFVEFKRRSARGLEVQSWKDSAGSQLFADGRCAEAPIAPCEVQGYVYDAKVRLAELAREVWHDHALADRLDAQAHELKERFDEHFWCDERGGYFALALDAEKRRVDSLCSNIGHLLWSGVAQPARVDALVDQLMGEELWSGWGVRTMSTGDAGYNPLAYHNGAVWPHDNSLIALGLARYGYWEEAYRIVRRMIEATGFFGYELPEVFAGFPRADTAFPVEYPTASRPQAWAAGTPILLLRVLLGLEPNRARRVLESRAPHPLPSWAGSIELAGVRAYGRQWDIRLDRGQVEVMHGI